MIDSSIVVTFLIGVFIGIISEVTSYVFKFWIYNKPAYPVINILLMFAGLMGGLSLLVTDLGMIPVFILTTIIGYFYEKINFNYLNWWQFPGDKFIIFKGKEACALSVAFLWGGIPLIIFLVQNSTF